MSNQWGYGPVQFSVEAGQEEIVRLDVPHRGTIKQINLKQLSGTDAGNFEIYDSEVAAMATAGSSADSATEGGDPEAHSITNGQVSITSGAYRAAVDYPYINRDGTPTNPVRRLWMRINSGGSGTETYGLSLLIEPSALNG